MKNLFKVVLTCLVILSSTSVYAATINGSMGIGGSYTASGGTDLSDATDILLNSVYGTSGTDDITMPFGVFGIVGAGASLDAFVPVSNFFSVNGYTLDLDSITVVDQELSLLTLSGAATLHATGFDATAATWTFSAESATSYSISVTTTAIPVPAAVWLFGSGLLSLVGVVRRKV